MRIAFVSHTAYPQAIGGRERHVHFLAKAFSEKKKADVVVLAAGRGRRVVRRKIERSYELVEVPGFSFKVCSNPLQVYHVTPSLGKVLAGLQPDLIHAFEYGSHTTTVSARCAFSLRVPFVLTVYGYQLRGVFRQACKKIYDMAIGRSLLRRARAVICVSELQRLEMERIKGEGGSARVFVRPNGISVCDYMDLASQPVAPALAAGLSSFRDGKVNILSVARILPRKGLDVLIEAVDLLVRGLGVRDFRLILAGPDCGELANLRSLIARRGLERFVGIVDPLPYEEIGHLFRFCDIFASASFYEGVPLVFLEAMCFGKPVVATSLPGNRVVVREGETGFLVEPYDAPGLARALARLIEDEPLRRRMGEAAVRRVADFDIAHEVDFLYNEVYPAVSPAPDGTGRAGFRPTGGIPKNQGPRA